MIYIKVQSEFEAKSDELEGGDVTKSGDHSMFLKQMLRAFTSILAVVLTFAAILRAQETTSTLTSSATSTVEVERLC